jgi:hypothetical protein
MLCIAMHGGAHAPTICLGSRPGPEPKEKAGAVGSSGAAPLEAEGAIVIGVLSLCCGGSGGCWEQQEGGRERMALQALTPKQ